MYSLWRIWNLQVIQQHSVWPLESCLLLRDGGVTNDTGTSYGLKWSRFAKGHEYSQCHGRADTLVALFLSGRTRFPLASSLHAVLVPSTYFPQTPYNENTLENFFNPQGLWLIIKKHLSSTRLLYACHLLRFEDRIPSDLENILSTLAFFNTEVGAEMSHRGKSKED